VKSVSQALDKFHVVLKDQVVAENLNEKLAEYAFFPLTHIFNESQRLSSRCLELAVLSLQILIVQGWREKLAPEMGKQLLILLTLMAGTTPGQTRTESPSDDLKVAAYDCIRIVATWLGGSPKSKSIFEDVGTRNIVDQIAFLLLDAISVDKSDKVQFSASTTLLEVEKQIDSRLILASLLPRTISTLTKVLRPSTQQRRTYKVLEANLNLMRVTLQRVLSDDIALAGPGSEKAEIADKEKTEVPANSSESATVLDTSWLKATSSQVKIALINVAQLCVHDRLEVRQALAQLCLMVLQDCFESLYDSVSVMLETLISLVSEQETQDINENLKYLLTTRPSLIDDLKTLLQKWMVSLPRLMQAADDRPRRRVLYQISQAVRLFSSMGYKSGISLQSLPNTLIDSVVGLIQPRSQGSIFAISEPSSSISQLLTDRTTDGPYQFQAVVLGQKSQRGSLLELQAMVTSLAALEHSPGITRALIDAIPLAEGTQQMSAMWLALNLLTNTTSDVLDDFVVVDHDSRVLTTSKPFLISDLYSYTLPLLVEDDLEESTAVEWQTQALALECLVLQAEQLGTSYRPELIDSLYPVLSFLGSRNVPLQQHGMTALNLLAKACQYQSVTDMLVDNVDYLVNSIALKLNSSNLAPQAPQVLLMMVRLCGARLIPYLDDLIGSIFVALDDFHGYPQLVELLFQVLGAIVDEGAKQPTLAITEGKEGPTHQKPLQIASTSDDVLGDLHARKIRKLKLEEEVDKEATSAPKRPWSDDLDGPQPEKNTSDDATLVGEEGENEAMPPSTLLDEKEKPLSKPHQLLLSIGQATTPHLSSPSLKVRHTLLNLLDRIAPLLARDENSFLPLVNAIWPSLTARLFVEVGADGDGEAAFNVSAAAETISKLCEGAGDFMASRIEEIFPQLQSMWKRTWKNVEVDRFRKMAKTTNVNVGQNLTASVDLQLVKSSHGDMGTLKNSSQQLSVASRTTDMQVLNALVVLFTSILNYVRITDDNGDAILGMLAPIMDDPGRDSVREALETWNANAVWLRRQKTIIEGEMMQGIRETTDWVWKPIHGPPVWGHPSSSNPLPEIVF
jgi:TELO2-interacting protein 1